MARMMNRMMMMMAITTFRLVIFADLWRKVGLLGGLEEKPL